MLCAFLLRCGIGGLNTGESLCSVLSCCVVGLVALTPVSRSALCFPAALWDCWPRLCCQIAGLNTGESQGSVLSCCVVGLLASAPMSRNALCFPAALWDCWPQHW